MQSKIMMAPVTALVHTCKHKHHILLRGSSWEEVGTGRWEMKGEERWGFGWKRIERRKKQVCRKAMLLKTCSFKINICSNICNIDLIKMCVFYVWISWMYLFCTVPISRILNFWMRYIKQKHIVKNLIHTKKNSENAINKYFFTMVYKNLLFLNSSLNMWLFVESFYKWFYSSIFSQTHLYMYEWIYIKLVLWFFLVEGLSKILLYILKNNWKSCKSNQH